MNYKRKQVLHDNVVPGWNGNKCIFFVYELQKKTSVVPGWNGNKCMLKYMSLDSNIIEFFFSISELVFFEVYQILIVSCNKGSWNQETHTLNI
jgi:hypothetical protein